MQGGDVNDLHLIFGLHIYLRNCYVYRMHNLVVDMKNKIKFWLKNHTENNEKQVIMLCDVLEDRIQSLLLMQFIYRTVSSRVLLARFSVVNRTRFQLILKTMLYLCKYLAILILFKPMSIHFLYRTVSYGLLLTHINAMLFSRHLWFCCKNFYKT